MGIFLELFWLLVSHVIPLWSKNILGMARVLFNLLRLVLWPRAWSVLVNVACVLLWVDNTPLTINRTTSLGSVVLASSALHVFCRRISHLRRGLKSPAAALSAASLRSVSSSSWIPSSSEVCEHLGLFCLPDAGVPLAFGMTLFVPEKHLCSGIYLV